MVSVFDQKRLKKDHAYISFFLFYQNLATINQPILQVLWLLKGQWIQGP